MTKHTGARIPLPSIVVRLALILSVIAAIAILIIIITTSTANSMMSAPKTEMPNIPSNILPQYSPTSFKSFDNQTNLSGWFFKTENPKSTVIIVHGTASNRIPFNVDMVDLIEDLLNDGFNVFLFDQRNSGESEGATSGFGYMEWKDVIGAIDHVRKISVTTDVILYGIGSGCSSSLIAMDKLPMSGEYGTEYSEDILSLPFDRSYIAGLILDSPAKFADDYIRPLVIKESAFGFITQYFVPYAIRISSGETDNYNLAAEIARLSVPICILYGDRDVFIGTDNIEQIVLERERLHPSTSFSQEFGGAGYLEAFAIEPTEYRAAIKEFMNTHFK
jgi:pimeloyl-ACP methyl ester carboxylesterase